MKDKRQRQAFPWPYDPQLAYIINAAYSGYPLPSFAGYYASFASRYPPTPAPYFATPRPQGMIAPAPAQTTTYPRGATEAPAFTTFGTPCVDPCRCQLVTFPQRPLVPSSPPSSTLTPPQETTRVMTTDTQPVPPRTQLFQPYKTDMESA